MRKNRRIAARSRLVRALLALLVLGLACTASPSRPAWAAEAGKTGKKAAYTLKEKETHEGDLYLYSATVRVAGVQDGDLTAFTHSVTVTGEVTGDMFVMAQTIIIDGKVGDSARFFASDVKINGTIDGDVVAFAGDVTLAPGAHVTGDLQAVAGHVVINGTVDGSVDAKGGSVEIGGRIGENVEIKSDEVEVSPDARIGGDLTYTSRNRLDLEGKGIVAGDIDYMEKKKKEAGGGPFRAGNVLKWIWFTAAGLVAGLVALALSRNLAPAVLASLSGDALRSAGIGFIAVIVVPVAALLSCILIITIPLAFLVFLLYCVALYIAKVPVGLFIGQKIFKLLGRTDPSPYACLAAGIIALYLVFPIPFIGKLAWFACLFLGLGAIILGVRGYLQARRAPAPPPLPV
jgi:cytoskeletal protein CcmA (bactofilin family)